MDTTVSESFTQLKQNDRLHLTAKLSKKSKKLLKEKAVFAEEERSLWERSKAILAQNIDDEENLKQSRRAYKEISKQLHHNAKSLQLVDMRLKAASELIKTAMDTVEITNKVSNFSIETFTARFVALKICSENNWAAIQEKLEQSEGIDDALIELEDGLSHLLRHRSLVERAERLRKMRGYREQLLRTEYEELLNRVAMLKSNLEMKNSTNQKLQQQFHQAGEELEDILSTEIENLDEVMVEEEELQQQLHACSQECDEAVLELSKFHEQNEKVLDKERMLDEQFIIMKIELENLTAMGRDDPEIVSVHHKNIRENLQAEMNEKLNALQDEVRRMQTELNCVENEHASLMVFLGSEQHDWPKEIEEAIEAGKQLEAMIAAERKANAVLRSKKMEVDMECSQLEIEANVLHESTNAEIAQYEAEISDLQKYLERLINEEKEETQRYEMISGHATSIARSAKHAYLRDEKLDVRSLWSNVAYKPDTSGFGNSSSNEFGRGSGSRARWLTVDNAAKTLFDKRDLESGMMSIARKFKDERAVDSEGTVPSDMHSSQVNEANPNANELIKEAANIGNYPLPPSAFGSPLSTNDSPDVVTDCEVSGSELDQSVWSDFSSLVK
ncbi:unnamed protein product [Litomosoides sigmodontis]|uniref:Uncharacterized protein n=1 Tax=Litomosoides sigmodontis TaxID=42156 RepID=A0A3P6UWY7_LITSI|nr:unnamed protein product [Litomosoides sigmodontis]